MARTGGDDEKIVRELEPVSAANEAFPRCDALHFGQQDLGVRLPAQQPANWSRDVGRRERRRRDLVQQWLKDVMVRAIDDGDGDGRILQCTRGVETAESTTDDDNVRAG